MKLLGVDASVIHLIILNLIFVKHYFFQTNKNRKAEGALLVDNGQLYKYLFSLQNGKIATGIKLLLS